MGESSDGIYIEDYEHHEYCERCHHEMELVIGVENYYDGYYCKNCGMNHPLREMRNEIALWLNCPHCAGDRMEVLEPSGYVCTDCGAKIYPEQLVPSMRKAFYTNDFRGFFSQDNQTVAKKETVQKREENVKNDIISCPFCRDGHLHELKIKKGFWLCDSCGHLYEKHCEGYYMERGLDCPKCGEGKIPYRFSTSHWHCPSCGGEFDSKAMGWDIGPGMDKKFIEFLESLKSQKPENGFNLYDGYEIGGPVKDDWKEWAKNQIVCPVCHERYLTKVEGKYWRCPYCYSTLDATTESGPARCGRCGGELTAAPCNNKNVCKDCGAVYESYTDGWNILRKDKNVCKDCGAVCESYTDGCNVLRKDKNQLFKCPVCSVSLKYIGNNMAQCPKCERKFERVSKFVCSQCGHEVWKNNELFKGSCPYCGSALENMEDVVGFFDYKMVEEGKGTGKKCLCCGGEIVRGEDGKLACSKCKVVYSGKCNFERGKTVVEGDCKVERPNETSNYDSYEIGGPMPENYMSKKCLRCGSEIVRVEDDKLVCSKCNVVYVERPNETLNKEKDLNCPGCGIKLKKVAGDNHLYYCVKCGRCYEDAGAFLVNKPLHCKNCGRSILAYNPKEFKYECPKCEATYYPTGEGCDKFCNKFQEEFYTGNVTEVKTVPVKDEPKKDAINPQHYKGKGGMQAIDVIEAFGLGFCLGNAVKYILRDGKKDDAVQDLKKAIWYIEREIKNLEAKK